MPSRIIKYFLAINISIVFANTVKAQAGLCPSNLDFEAGDFTGWVCNSGNVSLVGGMNTINWTTIGPPIPTFQTMQVNPAGTDFYGKFPQSCPNGSGYSIKLGNETATLTGGIGREASGVSYIYNIPGTLTRFSLLFQYAVVLHEGSHTDEQQSRFRARIKDLTTGTIIPCANFDFVVSSSLGGFLTSSVNSQVKYKSWTPVSIDLSSLIGRTIEVEFIVSECTQGGHFSYAYIDVNSNCNGAITGNYICPGNNGITLNAPFGFQNYTWYADNTFSTILSTTQTLTVTPAPPAGTIYPVIVEPFTGFGCRDTLYANVEIAGNPVANAGPDASTCTNVPLQLGTASVPGISYAWTPAALLSNPSISNPFASPPNGAPTEFIIKTTDILTGCFSEDTTYVSGRQADTTLTLTGNANFCAGDPVATALSVSSLLAAVQWYDGNTPIAGATGFTFQPTASGNYWAQVQQLGCTDSTRVTPVTINPTPVSNAGPDVSLCINETIQIGVPSNPLYSYTWTPSAQVSNAAVSNPTAWAIGATPQNFIVNTVDPVTGCSSKDTTVITGLVIDTAISLNGKNDYCVGDPAKGILSVNNSLSFVQWYDGTTPIPGATSFSFQPTVTGNYWAQLQQSGCTDSTRSFQFDIHPLPVADFTLSSDSACITNHSFTFTNKSTASDGAAMTYLWKLSDNTTQIVTDAIKTFTYPGTFTVHLTATTSFGCVDDTNDSTVYVMPNVNAAFTWDSICITRPVQFYNQSRENGSPQVNYNWNFNNGGPAFSIKNPPLVTYTTPGTVNAILKLTALGCESYPDSVIKKVQVNKQKDGYRYKDITVPQNSSKFINVRPGIGNIYLWKPRLQLSGYNAQYTEFFATGDDVKYLIDITDPHTCITTDTLLMQVLKKPGFYLPTAFTPNGDGLNDVAKPYLVGMKSLKSFSVFNRYGNLVFYSIKYGEGWDGKSKGVDQNPGVYVWILEFINDDGKKVTEKGTITIIR